MVAMKDIEFVRKCIDEDIHKFYIWRKWVNLRKEVLRMDKHECQECKRRGKYTRADTVHHVNHVKNYPELALSIWFIDSKGNKKRNLESVCRECHTHLHPELLLVKEPLTIERW